MQVVSSRGLHKLQFQKSQFRVVNKIGSFFEMYDLNEVTTLEQNWAVYHVVLTKCFKQQLPLSNVTSLCFCRHGHS